MFQPRQTPYPNGSSTADRALFVGALIQLNRVYGSGRIYRHIIAGKEIQSLNGETYDSVDPNDNHTIIARLPKHDLSDQNERMQLSAALSKVSTAQERWRLVPVEKRIELLEAISDMAQQRQWLFMAAMALEGGKRPFPNGYGEMEEVINFPKNNAELAKQMYSMRSPLMPKWMCDLNGYQWWPKGPLVTIDPFNFAGAIPIDKVTAALVTGNAVVMKASGHTPLQGYLLYQLIQDAFDAVKLENNGVVNFLSGHGGDMAMFLLKHPFINGYAFTGSHDVARSIRRALFDKYAEHGGQMQCVAEETSGRNPMVVWNDADIDRAVMFAVASLINNNGQTCSHLGDLILHKDIEKEFMDKFIHALDALNYGDVKDLKNHCGALISRENASHYLDIVDEMAASGKVRHVWTKRATTSPFAFNFMPVVLRYSGSSPNLGEYENAQIIKMIRDTEIFAPAVTTWVVETKDEMRRICLASMYRLTAAIHTHDIELVKYFVTQVPCAGQIYINGGTTGALVGQAFGGHALSASSADGVGASTLAALMKYVSLTNVAMYFPRGADRTMEKRWEIALNEMTSVSPEFNELY